MQKGAIAALLLALLVTVFVFWEGVDDSPDDLLHLDNGARVLSYSSEYSDSWAAALLIDGNADYGWASAEEAPFSHEFVFELGTPSEIHAVLFDNTNAEESGYPGISARQVELLVSTQGATRGFTSVLKEEIGQGTHTLLDISPPAQARWIKLLIHSNWGDAVYTELMEVKAYGQAIGE